MLLARAPLAASPFLSATILVGAIGLAFGCQQHTEEAADAGVTAGFAGAGLVAADCAAIIRDVRAAVDAFADSQRRRDADAAIGFLAPDFYMYVDGTRAGYEAVVEQMRTTLPSLQSLETTWSDIELTVLGRDHVLVTLLFEDTITDADGQIMSLRGPTTLLWQRIGDAWRIRYADADHYPGETP